MSLNHQSNSKFVESKPKANEIFNLLAAELCSSSPDKTKIKKLCDQGKILFSGDMVDLMSTVLFELSERPKQKMKT
jgi:hypothetical protein